MCSCSIFDLVEKYQFILDMFERFDANGDGRIELGKELVIENTAIANMLNNDPVHNDRFITVAELERAFADPDKLWLYVNSGAQRPSLWKAHEVIIEEGRDRRGLRNYIVKRSVIRTEPNSNLLSDAIPLVMKVGNSLAERFVRSLFRLALANRRACMLEAASNCVCSSECQHSWIIDLLWHKNWFGGKIDELSFEALDVLSSWLETTKDFRGLRRDVRVMFEYDGARTIVAHRNIMQGLADVWSRPMPDDASLVAVFDSRTLRVDIKTVRRGDVYNTRPHEAAVGSRIWKGNVVKSSIPHTPKAIDIVPWFVALGKAYLDDVINRVVRYIEENNIKSRTGSGGLISEVDRGIIMRLLCAEIMGDEFMTAGEQERWSDVEGLVNSIYFRLGAYGADAFSDLKSEDGARGLCQLTRSSYNGLRRDYGHLDPNFDRGSANHFNSILAMFMCIDEIKRTFLVRCTTPTNGYYKYRHVALKNIREPGIFGQFLAVSYNRGELGFRWLVGLEHLGDEPSRHRRKYIVADRYFCRKLQDDVAQPSGNAAACNMSVGASELIYPLFNAPSETGLSTDSIVMAGRIRQRHITGDDVSDNISPTRRDRRTTHLLGKRGNTGRRTPGSKRKK